VVAVEANPDVHQVLTDIVNLNKLPNVDVLNVALSPSLGTVTINDEVETYLSGSMQSTETAAKGFKVEGMPLSELMKRYGIMEVDLLKVNIEGAERFLVDEIRPEIFENIRNVAISCHDFRYRKEGLEFFRTKELILNYFDRMGYQIKSQSTGIDYIDDWIYGVHK
jgi:FkbM family methyltransferase